MTRQPDATITFPEHWITGPWMHHESVLTIRLPQGGRAFIAGGVLQDGTNLIGLVYPGGQRVLRAGPATGWAIEEKYEGRPLRAGRDKALLSAWRAVVESSVYGKKAAEAELGKRSAEW